MYIKKAKMKVMNKFLLTSLLALAATSVHADTEEDGRFWLNINAKGSLPIEGLNWYAEVQPRWRDEGANFDQLIIRPALFYKLSPKSSVWLGYANVTSHPAGKKNTNEDRLWQQFSYSFDPIADIAITSRTRFEQRWLDTGDDVGYRLRQMIKLSKPILSVPNLSWVVSDEYYLNTNSTDWGARSGFDQNRLFLGGAYKINSHAKIEAGYLNQYVNGRTVDRMNHVLSTTLELTF